MDAEAPDIDPREVRTKRPGWKDINWRHMGETSWRGIKRATRGVGQVANAVFGFVGKVGGLFMGILGNIFLGVTVLGGAMIGPGIYHMTQENEIVRAKVTGREQADAKTQYHGLKYFIYTDVAGKLDTASIASGRALQEGCIYDFNLKSARIQWWPLSYSRSITGYNGVSCPSPDKK